MAIEQKMIELRVPPLGESINEATISNWYVVLGDFVPKDKLLFDIETDKVTLEISAPINGYVDQILATKNQTVRAGEVVGVMREETKTHQIETSLVDQTEERIQTTSQDVVSESILKDGPDLHVVAEIPERIDVQTEKKTDAMISANSDHREPMSRIRRRIAERLKDAQNRAAILTTFNEIDLGAISQLRTQYQKAFTEKFQTKLGWMGFFIQAASRALQAYPIMNSRIDGDDVITPSSNHISVAVSTPYGLVTPVLRQVESMALPEVEKSLAVLAEKARNKAIEPDDLMGGTFTITNGGVFGSLLSTPILNAPQSAILGMHTIQERPVVVSGQIVIRPMMYVALSYDHRLIDGSDAVRFLVHIKNTLENPGVMWLELR